VIGSGDRIVPQNRILLGVIGRPHGVRGLVRVTSHTADPAGLTAYGPLSDEKGRRFVLRWRGEGVAEVEEQVDGVAVKVADRTAAEKLTNTRLYVDRAQLPEPEEEEFYLADLIGMAAVDADANGTVLGNVVTVHDYGAGASLEIVRDGAAPVLVPFTRACVPEVDLARGTVLVYLSRFAGEV
jgi:16S rRNA processing protein RimM